MYNIIPRNVLSQIVNISGKENKEMNKKEGEEAKRNWFILLVRERESVIRMGH
jgi:hypothetical protein